MPHEGNELIAKGAQNAFFDKSVENLPGEDKVKVLIGISMIVIIMGNHQFLRLRLTGNHTKTWIAIGIGHVKGSVAFEVDPTSCDQNNSTLFNRLSQGGPRHFVILDGLVFPLPGLFDKIHFEHCQPKPVF